MSDAQNTDFGKFLPGFDFLQNLVKGAAKGAPQVPNMASWIAPSMNAEEIEKRISELKTVQFWLEQNSKALSATVQALEVQKMTLATLKGMNVQVGDMASAFKFKGMESMFASTSAATPDKAAAAPVKTAAELAAEAEAAEKARKAAEPAAAAAPTPPVAGMVDPMQLWGSLTQQFQQIAASALKDVGTHAAIDATKNMASEFVKEAVSATQKVAETVTKSSLAAKPAAKAAAKPAVKPAAKAPVKAAAKKAAAKTTGRSS